MKGIVPAWRVGKDALLKPSGLIPHRHIGTTQLTRVSALPDSSIETFRKHAFNPAIPMLFQAGQFKTMPAVSKWFTNVTGKAIDLNADYLRTYGNTKVPVEVTFTYTNGSTTFTRSEQPLLFFLTSNKLSYNYQTKLDPGRASVYIAQCPLSNLPEALQLDLPTPHYITTAGRGDIYDSSIWLGRAPTYTPLHKDPNPNIFVQLAGKKVVRIFAPEIGNEMFAEARRKTQGPGSSGNGAIRGEEMMVGEERRVLEEVVWGKDVLGGEDAVLGQEAVLEAGDGLFIPRGWWHSVKGVGDGVIGSVNWWFR